MEKKSTNEGGTIVIQNLASERMMDATLKSWTPVDVVRLNRRALAGGLDFSTRMNLIPRRLFRRNVLRNQFNTLILIC